MDTCEIGQLSDVGYEKLWEPPSGLRGHVWLGLVEGMGVKDGRLRMACDLTLSARWE